MAIVTREIVKTEIPKETLEFFEGDELRVRCYIDKYALKDRNNNLLERNPLQMWERVSREIASVEKNYKLRNEWQKKFYWLLENFRMIPGGRILFGAGHYVRCSLLNCYVLPIKEDSIEGIFECAKEMARTYSFGGGVGIDISVLRPKGAPVNNPARFSTGSVSFMDLYSVATGLIGQHGRRGALMQTIEVRHPDIFDFINIKNDPERKKVRFANISVKVTDEFMEAVERDEEFILWFESDKVKRIENKVKARSIWDALVLAAHSSAEPGIMFWDNMKKESTSDIYEDMQIHTTNPCGEIPLEKYGNCCLGNLNIATFVIDKFGENPTFDYTNFEKALTYTVRFLDNVLKYNVGRHGLPEQEKAAVKGRRIGVGFTGLGSALTMLKKRYDDDETIGWVENLFKRAKNVVYQASSLIAKEKGSFPLFNLEKHLKLPFIERLKEETIELIKKDGLRNVALLTVPPVGSGSILAGVSSGIEPIFAGRFTRRSESLSQEEFEVDDWTVRKYKEITKTQKDKLPDYFVFAHQINPEKRVRIQGRIQAHIDQSISSTVNLPKETDPETVGKIYFKAWKAGCKCISVYREGSREGILLTEEIYKEQPPISKAKGISQKFEVQYVQKRGRKYIRPRQTPKVLNATRYRVKTPFGTAHTFIVRQDDRMVEVFMLIGKTGWTSQAEAESTGRDISSQLRSDIDPMHIIEQHIKIQGKRMIVDEVDFIYKGKRYIVRFTTFSLSDTFAKVMLIDMLVHDDITITEVREISGMKPEPIETFKFGKENITDDGRLNNSDHIAEPCPRCGGLLIFTGGCYYCTGCSFSECD